MTFLNSRNTLIGLNYGLLVPVAAFETASD